MAILFEVLKTRTLEITVFWGVTPYNLVDIYWGLKVICCVHRLCQSTSVEAVLFFEVSPRVRVCNNTRRYTQKDSKEFSYTRKLVTVKKHEDITRYKKIVK